MKKVALLLGLAFVSLTAIGQPDQTITAVYAGMTFRVPASPVIFGSLGPDNDILLIKYSDTAGKQYISFGTENSFDTGGCKPAHFFEATLSDEKDPPCTLSAVKSFKKVFVQGSDAGVWEGAQRDYYYFLSDQDASFVFFQADDERLIKLESDFLKPGEFRRLIGAIESH